MIRDRITKALRSFGQSLGGYAAEAFRVLNYLAAIPFFGFFGTFYFNHREDRDSARAQLGYDAWHLTLDVHYAQDYSRYRFSGVNLFEVLQIVRNIDSFNALISGRKPTTHMTYFTRAQRKRLRIKGQKKLIRRIRRRFANAA